jgi:hypothetical protein
MDTFNMSKVANAWRSIEVSLFLIVAAIIDIGCTNILLLGY